MHHIADADIAEALVWHLWQDHLPKRRRLRLIDGRQVRVYHPGTLNRDSGPDFLNAELALGPGRPLQGDVEVHIRPGDWRRHGHETDPQYNRVILHVVMWRDEGDDAAVKQNGQAVPTLVLSDWLSESFERLRRRYGRNASQGVYPCQRFVAHAGDAPVSRLLDESGDARFRAKAQAFARRMTRVSPEQVLYEGIMTAAGYAKNAEPFSALARRLPIGCIRDAVRTMPSARRITAIQSLLFGAAGLLPSQREGPAPAGPDAYTLNLEAQWTACGASLSIRPMDETAWRFFRLRPFNFPTVRLAGMSYLIAACLERDLVEPFWASIQANAGLPPQRQVRRLRGVLDGLLRHDPADYWCAHTTLGGTPHGGRTHLVGPERRRDIMVNAILPFLFVYTAQKGERERQAGILDLYAAHPKLSSNETMRAMLELIFQDAPSRSRLVDTARRQQGLLHIYDRTCEDKACEACVLGGKRS